jgi:hypothetical protein
MQVQVADTSIHCLHLLAIRGAQMANLSIRGVDDLAVERLKTAARRQGQSLNAYLIGLINRDTGVGGGEARPRYDDLDHLAGTWSAEDFEAFAAAQAGFERIDEGL